MNFIYGVICHQLTHSLVFLVNELLKSPHSIILIHVDQKADLAHFILNSDSMIRYIF